MINNIFNFINLHNGEQRKDKVLENVTANISFRGSIFGFLPVPLLSHLSD